MSVITKIDALPELADFPGERLHKHKVAAYARVSTDKDDQATSLAAQMDYYREKINEHPGWEFVNVYADGGISGLSTSRRDGFNQMIEDCLAGRVDIVLTKSISRFARNTVDTVSAIRRLKEKGVNVYFEKENIWTMDSKGEFLLTIMSSLAQEESRSISENTTWGQRKRFADGKASVGYGRFLGYDKAPHKYEMVINEEQAKTVRLIYRLFLKGLSCHAIAKELTERGLPTPGGKAVWHPSSVKSILTNEKYKGDALLQKGFTVDFLTKKRKKNDGELPQYYVHEDHEAIVSPWLFDYVQEQIDERLDAPGRYSGVTVLSGKIICGVCGELYHPRPWHSTTTNDLVWQCKNRVAKGTKCRSPNIYDRLLHYVIHDAAREAACERKVTDVVENEILCIVDEGRAESVRNWTRDFRDRDIWELQSDEDDLAVALKSITLMEEGIMQIMWLDGKASLYRKPGFTPKGGIVNMTDEQEETIRRLRLQGVSYGKIAEQLDMKTETVRSHCRRRGINGKDMPADVAAGICRCKNCGAEVTQDPGRKKKKFCSDECRLNWWNAHPDQVRHRSLREVVCANCGKTFSVYGSAERKYCCHECYIKARFGV